MVATAILAVLLVAAVSSVTAYPEECGRKGPSSRIIGGQNAAPGEFPWQASIQIPSHKNSTHQCGATIIGESWLITAAHCFPWYLAPYRNWLVKVGMWDVTSTTENTQNIEIEKIFIHPSWDRNDIYLGNDIALIRLKGKIDFTDPSAGVACPPNLTKDYRGEQDCIVSGWGYIGRDHGKFIEAKTLQKAKGQIWEREDVEVAFESHTTGPSKALLAFGRPGSMSVCMGDSGGPLVCKKADGAYSLVGILSFGPRDCGTSFGSNLPGMFTEVAAYNDWIIDTYFAHVQNAKLDQLFFQSN